MKLYTFVIPNDITPGRLLPLVRRMLPELSDAVIRDAFQRRDVKQNGERVNAKALLLPGAEIKLYAAEAAAQALVPILYRDENVLVVKKPAGVSCEPDPKGGKTIVQLAHDSLLIAEPEACEPLLCHRLDNPTEGLLLLARTERAQRAMQDAFRERKIHKQYLCLVKGTPREAHAVLRAYLVKDARQAKVRIVSHSSPGALPIVTEYEVLKQGECSRLLVTLHTGRTHQIRAQLAAIGHPLLGDDLYGDRAFTKRWKAKRLMLCAASLSFSLDGEWSYLNEKRFTVEPDF